MFCGLAILDKGVEGFDFAISKGRLAADEIIDSSTSPPGRFLLEVGRRILKAKPQTNLLAIGNPLLPLKSEQISGWLGQAKGPSVVTDEDGFPLVYLLPRTLFEEHARFLTLLCCCEGKIDARLLSGVLGSEVARLKGLVPKIGKYPVSTSTGWFQGRDRQNVLKMLLEDLALRGFSSLSRRLHRLLRGGGAQNRDAAL